MEQYTGIKWFNGDKIYRKTITFNAMPTPSGDQAVLTDPNVKVLVSAHGTFFDTNASPWSMLFPYEYGGETFTIAYRNDEFRTWQVNLSSHRVNGLVYCTLEYTKIE